MSMPQQVPIRMIVGPCRSGTTALLQAFAQHPDVHGVYQPIKTGLRLTGVPDYGIYHGSHPVFADHPVFVVAKETLGHSTWDECLFDPLENEAVIRQVRPLFVFRHPVHTWNSWKRFGWGSLALFLTVYQYQYGLMSRARAITPYAKAITVESLSRYKSVVFPQVCAGWDVPFAPEIVGEFPQSLFDTPRLYIAPAARQYSHAQGSHETLARSTTFAVPTVQANVTTTFEQQVIQDVLEPLYARVRHIETAELLAPDVLSPMHRHMSIA